MQAGGSSAAAEQQFSTYPIPSVSAICTFFATKPVWDASAIFLGLNNKDVCPHGATQGCSLLQQFTSCCLGTSGTGSVTSNC